MEIALSTQEIDMNEKLRGTGLVVFPDRMTKQYMLPAGSEVLLRMPNREVILTVGAFLESRNEVVALDPEYEFLRDVEKIRVLRVEEDRPVAGGLIVLSDADVSKEEIARAVETRSGINLHVLYQISGKYGMVFLGKEPCMTPVRVTPEGIRRVFQVKDISQWETYWKEYREWLESVRKHEAESLRKTEEIGIISTEADCLRKEIEAFCNEGNLIIAESGSLFETADFVTEDLVNRFCKQAAKHEELLGKDPKAVVQVDGEKKTVGEIVGEIGRIIADESHSGSFAVPAEKTCMVLFRRSIEDARGGLDTVKPEDSGPVDFLRRLGREGADASLEKEIGRLKDIDQGLDEKIQKKNEVKGRIENLKISLENIRDQLRDARKDFLKSRDQLRAQILEGLEKIGKFTKSSAYSPDTVHNSPFPDLAKEIGNFAERLSRPEGTQEEWGSLLKKLVRLQYILTKTESYLDYRVPRVRDMP